MMRETEGTGNEVGIRQFNILNNVFTFGPCNCIMLSYTHMHAHTQAHTNIPLKISFSFINFGKVNIGL